MKDDQSSADNDRMIWKWLRGAATTKGEYGNPPTTDSYTLCIYDDGALVASATAEHGGSCDGKPCWSESPTGFGYKDKDVDPFGVQKIKLQAGTDGAAKILFKGKGPSLEMPSLGSLTGPITVQMIMTAGAPCWGATYSAPFLRQSSTVFKDRGD